LLVFTDFFTANTQKRSVSHKQGIFQTYHASFDTVGWKSSWLSAIRTHCLPA